MSIENKTRTKTIQLQWVSTDIGYCRDYFKNNDTGAFYTLTSFQGSRIWNTTDSIDGEPDMPLEEGLIIEIVEDGQVISREVVSCLDGCNSFGCRITGGSKI